MKLDSFDIHTISNENKLVTCFKNDDVIKNFDDIISHQSKIKIPFFHSFSKYGDVRNFNFSIRKQHNTINIQIRVYNRYRKQYITNGKN